MPVEVGQELEVRVLKYDRERNRVSLGLKQLGEDPWDNIARRYPANSRVYGKVSNVTDYGAFGEIVSIAFAIDDAEPIVTWRELGERSEAQLLEEFWAALVPLRGEPVTWVGHNTMFDMLFLHQRGVVDRVKPSLHIPYLDSSWAGSWEDTMTLWGGNRASVSLEKLCVALGVPTPKDGIDGSEVWGIVQREGVGRIAEYNVADVVATREIHKRLTART